MKILRNPFHYEKKHFYTSFFICYDFPHRLYKRRNIFSEKMLFLVKNITKKAHIIFFLSLQKYFSINHLFFTIMKRSILTSLGYREDLPLLIFEENNGIDPSQSFIRCRHQGWTYAYNVETGNLQNN